MTPHDFVFNSIYKGALNEGVGERIAHEEAIMGLEQYKKNQFARKAAAVITDRIKLAKKRHKVAK